MDQASSSTASEPKPRHRKRRRLLVAAGVLLVLGALILTPPLINVGRYRRRIAITMSQSLGRPVHLDKVSLHLLPLPGLTLENLVVSEDPAFGYEPVIRANKVNATVRIGSLWRRQIEFSTIRFEVDERGSGPSVNLVRNAQGRWNLEDVLMRASHVETAPTEQTTAGSAPRFPYIEATGARVNIKLGDEKMPYSLTDADFALWLPSPQQWRVRLQGKPTRTDSNVQDTGVLRVEGSLKTAPTVDEVPVDVHLSWRGSPLGEASRLLTGNDAGWRGSLFLELALLGPLNHAAVTTHTQFNDLRRADFVPAKTLDVTLDCAANSNVIQATLDDAKCSVPVDNTTPLTLTAKNVDLQNPRAAQARATVEALPLTWALDWGRLLSPRIPADSEPHGTLHGELDWKPVAKSWQGKLSATLPPLPEDGDKTPHKPGSPVETSTVMNFDVDTSPAVVAGHAFLPLVKLEPVVLHPAPASTLTLVGQADANGYGLQLTGTGTSAQVRSLAGTFPFFAEGLDTAFPKEEHAETTHSLALTCARLWAAAQTCEPLVLPEPLKPHPHLGRRR
ncbi:MAG TPA: AsmA family protein [Acidobacteriaceae bacterium]|jgi:AsmA protein